MLISVIVQFMSSIYESNITPELQSEKRTTLLPDRSPIFDSTIAVSATL